MLVGVIAIAIGRLLRISRIRKSWRQVDVGVRAKLSASAVGRHENGSIGSLDALERHAAVFRLRLDLRLVGLAGELVRLADEEHAAIIQVLAAWFQRRGFIIEPEASFSEWGERGRIDLLAYDPRTGVLVIVEVKTLLLDLQDLFGRLNVKARLASTIGQRRGWTVSRSVVVLAVASNARNRAVVRQHPTLFAAFHRGALSRAVARGGVDQFLHWVAPSAAAGGAWIAGRQRVRRDDGQLSPGEA